MLDVESSTLSPAQAINGVPKRSFLRKWGPALAAIAGVLAINVALLGPTGSRMPELNQRHLLKQKLGAERTLAVEAMEYNDAEDRRVMGRSLSNIKSSRNLSEENGGVMEYTRRRARHLRARSRRDDQARQRKGMGRSSREMATSSRPEAPQLPAPAHPHPPARGGQRQFRHRPRR